MEAGDSALEVIQHTTAGVRAQSESTGQPMLTHVNHLNFGWSVTAEDLAAARQTGFFEIYNGHQLSFNAGDAEHFSPGAMWDVALTLRLAHQQAGVLLHAIATDDSHTWRERGVDQSNAGRGWIAVRAKHLTPESIVRAMEAGDFYASTGGPLGETRTRRGVHRA